MRPFIPSKIAEIIFAIIMGYFGYLHFKNVDMMAGGVPKFFPGDGKIWIYISGAGFILAAIAIIIDVQKTLACYLLAFVLLLFAFLINLKTYLNPPDEMMKAYALGGILKDTAMAMAAILIGNRRSK